MSCRQYNKGLSGILVFTFGGMTYSTSLIMRIYDIEDKNNEQKDYIQYIFGLVYLILEDLP